MSDIISWFNGIKNPLRSQETELSSLNYSPIPLDEENDDTASLLNKNTNRIRSNDDRKSSKSSNIAIYSISIVLVGIVILFFIRNTTFFPLNLIREDNYEPITYCDNIDVHPLPVKLNPGLQASNFPVTTSDYEAGLWFNQGLTLFYGFNGEDAIRSFRKALSLDPNMPMAYYGIALSIGSNINININQECDTYAYNVMQTAIALSNVIPISTLEKGLINALSTRYSNSLNPNFTDLSINYAEAMGELYRETDSSTNGYADLSTVYADSLMDLYPWILWKPNGDPNTTATQTIVDVLELAIQTTPNHLGANHYYIHAVEGSSFPQRAIDSAIKLSYLASDAGHILHMPSHIYARLGRYNDSIIANKQAILSDIFYTWKCTDYNSIYCLPIYSGHYFSHNVLFITLSYTMLGQMENALNTAIELDEFPLKYLPQQRNLEYYLSSYVLTLERFKQWDDIINYQLSSNITKLAGQCIFYWAKSKAYYWNGLYGDGDTYFNYFNNTKSQITNNDTWGNNRANDILNLAYYDILSLQSYLNNDLNKAITLIQSAITVQDSLIYDEPINWLPFRTKLGALYYKSQQYQLAQSAFIYDLGLNTPGVIPQIVNVNNIYSLYGLLETCKALNIDCSKYQDLYNQLTVETDITITIEFLI